MKRSDLDEYWDTNDLSRRDFLKLLGLSGGILVAVSFGESSLLQEQARRGGVTYPEDFNAYLLVNPNGRVTVYSGKIEMGQGVVTSLAQMAADELGVTLDSVDVVLGDTDLCPWDMGTFGSMTTRFFGPALRAAAAEARGVLLELAADKLKVPKEGLTAKDGVIFVTSNPSAKATYAELAGGKKIQRHLVQKAALTPVAEWNVMGKPELRRDSRLKVTGDADFAGDIRISGMLYARVLRPPAHGAKLKTLDTAGASSIEGVQVIHDGELVAALHGDPDVAEKALALIKAEYDVPDSNVNDTNIFDHLVQSAPQPHTAAEGGDLKQGEALSKISFDETYLNSYVAHAAMEPHTALVDVKGDRAMVWPSSQTPFRAKEEVAKVLGIPPDNVRVISPFVGGGFGGKSFNLQVTQAARLSKLAGKPVQVMWTRADEFFNDTFRPAAVMKIKSGIDAAGKIVLWDYAVYFAGERSAAQFYNIPNHRTISYGDWGGGGGGGTSAHPFGVGPWRAPGSNSNTFARECQIDIMAATAKVDPLEFRLNNLADDRMKNVLRAAADKFGWKPAVSPSGRGFGLVCADYSGTYVATIAEVAVDKGTGKVQVKRVVCAQDLGQCINPEGTTIQMEGCITMGLGYCLTEEVHFKGGAVLDQNFDTYELPRYSWLPKIETVIVKNDKLPPSGCGEPAIINMGAVVANAIYDATGARLYQLPMTKARVKAAIDKLGKK